MKIVIQKIDSASVNVVEEGGEKTISKIGRGLLILVGLGDDDPDVGDPHYKDVIKKILKLRIFEDEKGLMNRSVAVVNGEILLVSQFTLYADCKKGNRPSFVKAMPPEKAKRVYEAFVEEFKKSYTAGKVHDGKFGAHMKVSLINDGPVTILLDS